MKPKREPEILTAKLKYALNPLTLKAFDNSSPGLRFGNPGIYEAHFEDTTLKGLRRRNEV